METLKESIIEKLDNLPETTLREVMEYVTFLAWRGVGKEPSLLTAAGGLSGSPISAEQIEDELYGRQRVS